MSIQMLGRCGVALVLIALGSGCSMMGRGDSSRSSECSWYRSSCIHEGSYEPGEESYAEEEAKRLNKASSDRLRRSSGN
ncbi:hypothetical protein RAS12_04155 [Achromobacter seleniivolatilans]|uniref:Lipoprotein n=1 Tax=Achromobacter seleniivolatilans TaxID=3047478 RepID=A0ABY9M3I7_9BURK|nr:hypothetical protein [Achromobacter sp. R39]WMD21576.1 hypothetical protein RAS12_04155 [Achromobacter sp. R39]